MKNILFSVLAAVFIITSFTVSAQQQKAGAKQGNDINIVIAGIEKEELSEKETEGLLFLYEEEKLARDFYASLYEKWGRNIFRNISESEQTHMDAVKTLLEKYNVNIPEKGEGLFSNTGLEKLYSDLLADGMVSYEKALENALLVEEKDISDLKDEIRTSDNRDIRIAYQNLMKGSRNHLRSFSRQLEKNGGSYSPSFLESMEYSRIKNSDMERGGIITDPDYSF